MSDERQGPRDLECPRQSSDKYRPVWGKVPGIYGKSAGVIDARNDEFWGPILFPDGKLDEAELARQLTDFECLVDGAAEIVDEFADGMTGGYKPYTTQAVKEQIEETIRIRVEQAIEDHEEDTA